MLLLPLLAGSAIAADASNAKDLDEVLVQGTRAQLNQLREDIRKAEDLFFERFNELNTVREFDVHCGSEAPTGTQLRYRKCRAVFEEDALLEEGQDAVQIRQQFQSPGRNTSGPILRGPPVNPSIKINGLRPVFQRHMKEIVGRDEELIRLLRTKQELSDRYDALRREIFGLKPRQPESGTEASAESR